MAETAHTVTWRPGEPCPLCGQVEPHSVVYRHGESYCTPGESLRQHAEIAGHLLFGLYEARQLTSDRKKIDARIAELGLICEQGQRVPHQAPSKRGR